MTKETRLHNAGKTVSSTSVVGKTRQPHVKNEIRSLLTKYIKISSKYIKNLNMRQDTIKLLEENIGRTLSGINHSNIFFDPSPRIMETKIKINKWELLKLKSFCTAKDTINKMKRQHTDWEKMFANDVTDKGLVSKIYKQLMILNSIKTNNPLKKWGKT